MSITRKDFTEGLARIAVATRQAVDDATLAVYHDSLGAGTDRDEWTHFCRWAVNVDRWPAWFPRLAEVREALREFRGAAPIESEATAAYERVVAAGTYTPGGTFWNQRVIRETCGLAAHEAFLAAGGHHAFATTWRESERRAAFLAAYQAVARQNPEARLLPPAAPEGQRLLSGAVAVAVAEDEPSQAEAARVLHFLARGGEGQRARRALTSKEWSERVEVLRHQAEEMAGGVQ